MIPRAKSCRNTFTWPASSSYANAIVDREKIIAIANSKDSNFFFIIIVLSITSAIWYSIGTKLSFLIRHYYISFTPYL